MSLKTFPTTEKLVFAAKYVCYYRYQWFSRQRRIRQDLEWTRPKMIKKLADDEEISSSEDSLTQVLTFRQTICFSMNSDTFSHTLAISSGTHKLHRKHYRHKHVRTQLDNSLCSDKRGTKEALAFLKSEIKFCRSSIVVESSRRTLSRNPGF